MSMVLVPFTVEQDETGAWCARSDLGPFGVAFGEGGTRQEAIEDLQAGVALVFEDEGTIPDWLPRADVLAIPEIA
jgi:hypothetical protein